MITLMLLMAGVTATLFSGAVSLAGPRADHPAVRYVTVAPGETLWSIAGDVAPDQDRRVVVHRIIELNALSGANLSIGQRVAVPSR